MPKIADKRKVLGGKSLLKNDLQSDAKSMAEEWLTR